MPAKLDLDLSVKDIARLTSADALAAFFHRLGYPTERRAVLPPEALGLADTDKSIAAMELLSADDDAFLRVIFVQLRSVTAKARAELVRTFGKRTEDHLLVLAARDFDALEFVLVEKVQHQHKGPGGDAGTRALAKVFVVPRRWPQEMLRIVRRLTFTTEDGLRQYDKLRTVFDAAHFSGRYFQNRALFADHYLDHRLPEDAAWQDNPGPAFSAVGTLMRGARDRFGEKDEATVRAGLFEPLFAGVGFEAVRVKPSKDASPEPDYRLGGARDGKPRTVALVYAWGRWLDGPDAHDPDTPAENPGAAVVSLLERGDADWIIVTNGKLWRLYSRAAHSRSTNFYEVDLEDVLIASGQSDPNEAFRYWWLFFRPEAFAPGAEKDGKAACWLDGVAAGSRDYARDVEERLKPLVFHGVVPQLAAGFLEDRKSRLGERGKPSDAELEEVRAGTLTLLYRLLFLLYAESRDLLPVRESAYYALSLKRMKEEIAAVATDAESQADDKIADHYAKRATTLYDRLARLFRVMDEGDAAANVPTYNGGLFRLNPEHAADEREAATAAFLNEHKVPDSFLASAIDRLSRVEDPKAFALAFVDYKSLGVRQLGSIYEGLLEFKLRLADEDLPPVSAKGGKRAARLTRARGAKRSADTGVKKGEPYLANDKAERKATGSYYTPDHIVEYIVTHTVGPVLHRKLDALRPAFREAEKTYRRAYDNAKADPETIRGWRLKHGQTSGRTVTTSNEEIRRFALDEAYERHRDLVEQLFDLKVLDPAMGSGHFLVEVVDFLTDELLHFLNAFPVNPVGVILARTRSTILDSLREQKIEMDEGWERKLTDVHLLKRHVLKRCIYGVDLNPLSTELAKVSLWLDAFTLGAPLSFLDHHLRVGNSLIGGTIDELEHATAGQMFAVNWREPMHRAILHLLQVARAADSTAGEVKQAAATYEKFRETLGSFRIFLDLLVARHFEMERQVHDLLTIGRGFDTSNARTFRESVDDRYKATIDAAEARSVEHHFYHWELEFSEVFFNAVGTFAAGSAERKPVASSGFDAVIGNPPYDVLSEKETGQRLEAFQSLIRATPFYVPSLVGKNNLYKLFICRSFGLLKSGARLGFIVPMALLGDEQAHGVRKLILEEGAFERIEAFPQKDDPDRRVFPEAKLSTVACTIRRNRTDDRGSIILSRVHPANMVDAASPLLRLKNSDIPLYDPDNLSIVSCSQEDWELATRMFAHGRMTRLREYVEFFQGEVNETNETAKGNLVAPAHGTKVLIRGANICLYVMRDASQGDDLNLDVKRFLRGKAADSKAFHHKQRRVVWQNLSAQNNFRRLIAATLEPGEFCNHALSYCPEAKSKIDLRLLLALFNSKLADWYFRLGSTNNNVLQYLLYNLPCPAFCSDSLPAHDAIRKSVKRAMQARDYVACYEMAMPLVSHAPFSPIVREVLIDAVDEIVRIERARGSISRSQRSALAAQAQPVQALIDRLLFACAGMSDAESERLQRRLAHML